MRIRACLRSMCAGRCMKERRGPGTMRRALGRGNRLVSPSHQQETALTPAAAPLSSHEHADRDTARGRAITPRGSIRALFVCWCFQRRRLRVNEPLAVSNCFGFFVAAPCCYTSPMPGSHAPGRRGHAIGGRRDEGNVHFKCHSRPAMLRFPHV